MQWGSIESLTILTSSLIQVFLLHAAARLSPVNITLQYPRKKHTKIQMIGSLYYHTSFILVPGNLMRKLLFHAFTKIVNWLVKLNKNNFKNWRCSQNHISHLLTIQVFVLRKGQRGCNQETYIRNTVPFQACMIQIFYECMISKQNWAPLIIFQHSAVKSLLIKNAFKSRFTQIIFTSSVDFGIFCDQKNIAGGNSILLWDLRRTYGDLILMEKLLFRLFKLLFCTHIVAIDTDWEWKDDRWVLLHRDRVKSLQIPQLKYPC